jgi:nucleoside-diphosphate-sugar epimerase
MKCLIGRNGFIGSQIAKRIGEFETIPNNKSEIIYFFGSPSSVILFNKNLDYCMRETINSFLEVCSLAKRNNAYLVYPSSATVNNKNNSYARCKSALEEIAQGYNIKSLGLRISASYGPGEGHKGEYASIIYQWCKQMNNGERPVIWGDGTQTRDFIYIDDVIDNIMELASNKAEGIYEIGTGINTSFNEIIATINKVLETDIKPIYIDKPDSYIQETPVKSVPCKVSLEEGIKKIIESL